MDEHLITQVKQGNQEALARLLFNNYEIVYRYLLKLTLSKSTSEDIVQDTMLRAIEKIERYDEAKSKFSTWLITIAQNIYLDRVRESKRRQKYIKEADVYESLFNISETYDDSWNRTLTALSKLNEEHRVPIILKHYYGYAYEEVSKRMRIPLGTVKSRIFNGLKILKKELDLDD